MNRLVSVTDADGGITSFTYDEVNNVRVATLPNGTTRTDTYDALHRLTQREHRNAGGVFASYQFTLGPTGNRTQVVENTGRTVQYAYDNLYRLKQEKITEPAAPAHTIDYTMDAVGNRLTRADSVEGATTSTYDDNDQLLSETLGGVATTYSYDANGNTLTRGRDAANRATYRWDFQNRLAGADVTEAGATKQLAYQYDDDGIRVAAFVDGDETRYLIDANRPYAQVVEEYAPNGTVRAAYTHGPHHLISQSRAGARTWYHADGLGSTRALTSQSGTPTDRYHFDAYGRTLTQTGPTENAYLYAGEQRDKNLGLDYLRARYLNFGAGRFYGRDAFRGYPQIPSTLHRFSYVSDDPANRIDPSGHYSLAEVSASLAIQANLQTLASQNLFLGARSAVLGAGAALLLKPAFQLRNTAFNIIISAEDDRNRNTGVDLLIEANGLVSEAAKTIKDLDRLIDYLEFAHSALGVVVTHADRTIYLLQTETRTLRQTVAVDETIRKLDEVKEFSDGFISLTRRYINGNPGNFRQQITGYEYIFVRDISNRLLSISDLFSNAISFDYSD